MNPYIIFGLILAWVVSLGFVYKEGRSDGKARCIAEHSRQLDVANMASEAAASAAANAIRKITVRNTTIHEQAQTEIRHEPVYIDCVHPDRVKRLLDAALTNTDPAASSLDRGQLPASNPAR